MKKIFQLNAVIIVIFAVCALSVFSFTTSNNLVNLPNFDWFNGEYGDGIEINNTDNAHSLDNIGDTINLQDVNPNNSGSYINYEKFNTGFQWLQNIKKQAVTGVPLNKGFMPNGNLLSDFGVTNSAEKYLKVNSILDWNPDKDQDAKYNKSVIPLQKVENVPVSNGSKQDQNILYNQLGFSSRKHRTFDNTIVGTKNPLEDTMLNWQYVNKYVNWSGSWFEGPIMPPPADVIDQAHLNGVPIYGNIFLDGYHGLTKSMLKDFLSQNSDGSYKIASILIKIALYEGFDGWFWNNEPNGSSPNGTILDYNVVFDIIQQFNKLAASSNNPQANNLKIIFYKNDASVSKSNNMYDDKETAKMAYSGAIAKNNNYHTPTDIQLNFGETPIKTIDFLKDHNQDTSYPYSAKNLSSMIDIADNQMYFGTYDYRQLAYAENFDNNTPNYNKNCYIGFSDYLDKGAGFFGEDYAYNFAKNAGESNLNAYLFGTQVTNLFNEIQFSGTNTFISPIDEGMQYNNKINDYLGLDFTKFVQGAFTSDPRIKVKNKGEENTFIKNNIYDYWKNKTKGYNTTSFGVGDLVREKTKIFDDNNSNFSLNLSTNFSMGSGIKFINRDLKGNISEDIENYPWTNRRLTDILPTYQWRIYDDENQNYPLPINQISGFYDYDNVYQKGNSIAIGSGFNEKGTVQPAEWDTSKIYDWDIMGTNLKNKNHKISFIYNENSNGSSNAKVKLLITVLNNDKINKISVNPKENILLPNGWTKITYDLNDLNCSVNEKNPIAQIGLQIHPLNKQFKFNVGQFSINTSSSLNKNILMNEINNVQSEYLIKRKEKNNYFYDIRFQWNRNKNDELSYYEIFYFYDNKYYRIGETTQNCYYLNNLFAQNNKIKLMIKPVYNGLLSSQSYVFNVKAI